MADSARPAGPRIMRIAGTVEFVLAIACLATPIIRRPVGDMLAVVVAAALLLGSGILFFMARRMELDLSTMPQPASTAPGMR